MKPILHIDFETRSALDLPTVGLWNYVRHPTTDVWCMAWAIGEAEPEVWKPANNLTASQITIQNHLAFGGTVVAHNAPFELAVWNEIMVKRYGWPVLKPEQMVCTMAQAYAMSLPGSLENCALALGLPILKDEEGYGLMLRMARPRAYGKDGTPIWWTDPDRLARLYAYCQQDVRVEREIHKRLMPLSGSERKVWLMDYAINQRGIPVDVVTATAGIKMAETIKVKCDQELAVATKGSATSCTALDALKEWMSDRLQIPVPSLAKDTVTNLLLRPNLPDDVKQALLLRQEAGKASTAKLNPMVEMAGTDNRIHNVFQYHGASTGRWAGRGIQPHNFPRDVPSAETVENILALVRKGDAAAIDTIYGPPMSMLSKCLRGFIWNGGEDYRVIVGDLANVEGRGTAWLSGEQWKINAYKAADAGTGPGLYELAYAKAFGVPVESVKNPSPERQKGKVAELAFGYQGALGAWRKFDQTVPDQQVEEIKVAWRAAHPQIVKTWYALQNAAIKAVQHPGEVYSAGHPGRAAKFKVSGSFLWCLLPSGRALCYPYPKILPGLYGDQLTYMTVPGVDKSDIIADPHNASGWARVGTYGGSLMENVIQAICRDLLVHVMQQFSDIVLHVHDEVVRHVPVSQADAAREDLEHAMRSPPAWAKDFPMWAECKIMERYGK